MIIVRISKVGRVKATECRVDFLLSEKDSILSGEFDTESVIGDIRIAEKRRL